MSTATDLNDSEMEPVNAAGSNGPGTPAEPHLSALAVPNVRLDQINNWTWVNELPFDPIAERLLNIEAHDEQGELQKGVLSVTFARPLLVEGMGWACLYRLDSMGRVHVSPARGVDAVDALQQAFEMVHRQLQAMGRRHRITFGESDDLGFAPGSDNAAPKGQGCPVMNGSMVLS